MAGDRRPEAWPASLVGDAGQMNEQGVPLGRRYAFSPGCPRRRCPTAPTRWSTTAPTRHPTAPTATRLRRFPYLVRGENENSDHLVWAEPKRARSHARRPGLPSLPRASPFVVLCTLVVPPEYRRSPPPASQREPFSGPRTPRPALGSLALAPPRDMPLSLRLRLAAGPLGVPRVACRRSPFRPSAKIYSCSTAVPVGSYSRVLRMAFSEN